MLVKVTSRLTQEQVNILKFEGISQGIRNAVTIYAKKFAFHIKMQRFNTYATANFDIKATNLEDAINQIKHFKNVLNQENTIKEAFWELSEITQVNQ